jgi:hypothetical protein
MKTSTLETFPADLILSAADIKGIKSVASGKYRLSEVAEFGGTYWATHLVRDPRDEFGVQFSGISGLKLAERYRDQLTSAGFADRDERKGNGKATFVRNIPQLPNGSPDNAAILEAKEALDVIFSRPSLGKDKQASPDAPVAKGNFATELRNSLPFFIDLELPERTSETPREVIF